MDLLPAFQNNNNNNNNNNVPEDVMKDDSAKLFDLAKSCVFIEDTVMSENQYVDPSTSCCTICGKIMKKRSIEFHAPFCKIGNKDKFRCTIGNCGRSFRKLTDKVDHARLAHSILVKYDTAGRGKCDFCHKFFPLDRLPHHRKQCELRRYSCPVSGCKYVFCTVSGRDKHLQNYHSAENNLGPNQECLIFVNPQFAADNPGAESDPLDVEPPMLQGEPEIIIEEPDSGPANKIICDHCKLVIPAAVMGQHVQYCLGKVKQERRDDDDEKCDIRTKRAVILLHRIPESTLEFYRKKSAGQGPAKILLRLNREADENWCLKV